MKPRLIDPAIWFSEDFRGLNHRQQILFICCITTADDYGRGRTSALRCLFTDIRPQELGKDLVKLDHLDMVRGYTIAGKDYFCLPQWETFQGGQRFRSKATIPEPPQKTKDLGSFSTAGKLHGGSSVEESRVREDPSDLLPRRQKDGGKKAWRSARVNSSAQRAFKIFCENYERSFRTGYPGAAAAAVAQFKRAVRKNSFTVIEKCLQLFWEARRGDDNRERRGEPPTNGHKTLPSVTYFISCLPAIISDHGPKYQTLKDQDAAGEATAWTEYQGGQLFQ